MFYRHKYLTLFNFSYLLVQIHHPQQLKAKYHSRGKPILRIYIQIYQMTEFKAVPAWLALPDIKL